MLNRSWLAHHGVKGQKWGVRNGPPYPIEDKTLAKGTRLNSVSFIPNSDRYKARGTVYTYNPNDEWDSKVYKGPFSYYKMRYTNMMMYEHQYEVAEDLKMPTSKERIDEFINLYKDKPSSVAKDLKTIQKEAKKYGLDVSDTAKNVIVKKLRTDADYKAAYELFNHAMENVGRFRSAKAYLDIMQTKYDAMVDDNNQGIYNMAHDPIIIFRADKVLKSIGDAKMIEVEEVMKNLKEVDEEMQKHGRRAQL